MVKINERLVLNGQYLRKSPVFWVRRRWRIKTGVWWKPVDRWNPQMDTDY